MTDQESANNIDDESIYAAALSEIQSGQLKQGIWAKAFAESDGDETRTKALYIRLRVQQQRDREKQEHYTAQIKTNSDSQSTANVNANDNLATAEKERSNSNSGFTNTAIQSDSLATAWPRFFARFFDVCWEVLLVSFVISAVLGQNSANFSEWINKPGASQLFVILCLPIALIMDALLYGLFENTPGKAWLGLKVHTMDGKPLSLASYIARNFSLWASGLAFGIPLINLITMAIQYRCFSKDGATFYDKGLRFRVIATPVGGIRKITFGVAFASVSFLLMLLNSMQQNAHHAEQNVQNIQRHTPSDQHVESETGITCAVVEKIGNMLESGATDADIDAYIVTIGWTKENFKKASLVSGKKIEACHNAFLERADKNLKEGEAFLAENKKKNDVITLTSGLQYKVITTGKGGSPNAKDSVTVHYRGSFINGQIFDSSYERDEPVTFPVNGIILGWTEALQKMKVGDKWQLFTPSNLAYGKAGSGPIGPNAVLIFDIELLEIK